MVRFFTAFSAVALVATLTVPAAAVEPSRSHPVARVALADTTSNMVPGSDLAMWTPHGERTVVVAAKAKRDEQLQRLARRIVSRTSLIARSLTRSAMRFIGTPYVFGGTSSSGFDCSGYTQHVFAMLGVSLPRTADAQYYDGGRPAGGVRAGDLVFFQTYEPGPSHVGIYIGHGRFIHSSSSHGVMISALGDSYWSTRYLGARRYALAGFH